MAYGRRGEEEVPQAEYNPSYSAWENKTSLAGNIPNKQRDVKNQEENPEQFEQTPDRQESSKRSGKDFWKNTKQKLSGVARGKIGKKTAALALVVSLLTSGGFMAIQTAPMAGLLQIAEVFGDFNSQLAGVDKTSTQLIRAKLTKDTAGSCGVIKLVCRFQTVNMKNFEDSIKRIPGAEVTFDDSKGWGQNRGQIKSISFTLDNGTKITADSPEKYTQLKANDVKFREKMLLVHNPKFASVNDAPAMKLIKKMKTSTTKKLNSNDPKKLQQEVDNQVTGRGSTSLKTPRLTAEEKDGKPTGSYLDEEGRVYTEVEKNNLEKTADLIKKAPTTRSVIGSLGKGVAITGAADTACSAYNFARVASVLGKTAMLAAAVRFTMVYLNTVGAMKAQMITPEQMEFINKPLIERDTREKVPDESKIDSTPEGQPLPLINNPDYNKTGFDAAFYKMAAYQDKPTITSSVARLLPNAGLSGTLGGILLSISRILGAKSPKDVAAKCKIIQNPMVRGGSLVVGAIAGLGSFGITTGVTMAGSVALAFATPYLLSLIKERMSLEMFKWDSLSSTDKMNVAAIGADELYNGIARQRGMMALPAEQMVEYQNTNRQVEISYNETERVAAARTPFDMNNRFSFIGSLARTLLPINMAVINGGSRSLTVLPQLFSQAGALINPQSSALISRKISLERYKQCYDTEYDSMNIAVNPTCVVQYGMTKRAMDLDPIENIQWLVANGELKADTDDMSPQDNKQDWNLKKYVADCVERAAGAYEAPDEESNNGAGCSDPKNLEKNERYSKFLVSYSVNEGIDTLPGTKGSSSDAFGTGAQGEVSKDGWAWPTTPDGAITSGYKSDGRPDHRGIDIAQPGGAQDKPIFAARDGKVIAAGPADGFGNWIIIQHDIDGQRADTVYGHMYDNGVLIKQGDEVKAGQEIGKIGSNGWSTGPHLHFEIWLGGRLGNGGREDDPTKYVGSGGVRT